MRRIRKKLENSGSPLEVMARLEIFGQALRSGSGGTEEGGGDRVGGACLGFGTRLGSGHSLGRTGGQG